MTRSEQVLEFINNFINHDKINDEQKEIIIHQFRCGYCYHFALMLKGIFNRGKIVWCAPLGHICWMDEDGIPYDIEGINYSECDYYIPISYIEQGLADFTRIPGEGFNASKEYIENAISEYKSDNGIK